MQTRDAAPVLHPSAALAAAATALLLGCTSASRPGNAPAPPAAIAVASWPEGQAFAARLWSDASDEPSVRAAGVWWREALRQTTRFELTEVERGRDLLLLQIDAAAGTLAAVWRTPDGVDRLLGGGRFERPDQLPQAIDQLAWSCRLALGEAATRPVPVALGTSQQARVVLAAADAQQLLQLGGVEAAHSALRTARSRDGGSPFVLDGLASCQLLRGELAAAERTATEALSYGERLLPTTQHRLLRTLLLTQASRQPERAAAADAKLLQLAEVATGERPHDPQVAFTAALARNFRGDFAAARSLLAELSRRLPEQPMVAYHLGWACLGSGDAAAAADAFAAASSRLPEPWLLLPRCLALYEAGRHAQLTELLERLRRDADGDGRGLEHELLRLMAAHALLQGDRPRARALLADDLRHLVQQPLLLRQRVGEFAELGLVLVRLGGDPELPNLLATLQAQHTGTAVADACAFVGGLLAVQNGNHDIEPTVEGLRRGGDNAFAELLQAYAHERAGEVADQQAALARAARLSATPLTKALLARAMRAAGRLDEAAQLTTALRREMRTIALRSTCRHPIAGPELAFADGYDL